ncbi:MAG: hypothetical protein ACW97X_14205, partial [Candidatus Hodarchaeales archaeon]
SYSSQYDIQYTISSGETAGGDNQVVITVYDQVSNIITATLVCTLDNDAPQALTISSVETQSSALLYYNASNTRLYFSNDQSMSESFIIQVTGNDLGSGRLNATGENEFGDTPEDTIYSNYYELTYQIDQDEEIIDGNITVWLFDQVGNSDSINLTCVKDNSAPDITIEFPDHKIWNNTDGGVASFGGSVSDKGITYLSGITPNSFNYSVDGGLTNVTFDNDNPGGSTWIDEDGDIPTVNDANITLIIYVWDRVGNVNSSSVEIWHDDTTPTIAYIDPTDGNVTNNGVFYQLNDNATTYFDIDFRVNGSKSFSSDLVSAEYRTDDGQGWYTIFNYTLSPSSVDYTADWQIERWNETLFNGENTIDLRVTDEAGNILIHSYSYLATGFLLLLDTEGPILVSISVMGDESGISNSNFYDWDGIDFYLTFNFSSKEIVNKVYFYSDMNPQEKVYANKSGVEVFTWYRNYINSTLSYYYILTNQLVNYDIGNTGNRSIFIRTENIAGLNSTWEEVYLFVDEEDPTLTLDSITELNNTWTMYPEILTGNGTLYYSDEMGTTHAGFSVTLVSGDPNGGSGMSDGYVHFKAFDAIAYQNDTHTGEFYVNNSPEPSDPWIKAYAIDASGRNSSIFSFVRVRKDTTAPTLPSITQISESSEYLYYDDPIFFFSNDQPMGELFTITLLTGDNGAG